MRRGPFLFTFAAGCVTFLAASTGHLRAAGQQAAAPATTAVAPASASVAVDRALVDKYCVTCHNQRAKTAGLAFDTLDLGNPAAGAEIWEKAIRKIRGGLMPPVGMPRPDKATLAGLASYLETSIDKAAATHPNPGRPVLHRLNRSEYGNAIRDLLALDVDVTG